jgi:hypothetical protein
MKTVYNHSEELAHIWAHKRQAEARMPERPGMNGGRVIQAFVEGDYFYSYGKHYCIGRHLPGGWVAINLEKNSSTTNRHVWEARHATRHLKQVSVLNPEHDAPDTEGTQALVDNLLAKALRAKADGNRPVYLSQAAQITADFNQFAKLLKHKARIKPIDAATWSPEQHREHLAKKAVSEKRRAVSQAKAFRRLQAVAITAWRRSGSPALSRDLPTMLRLDLPSFMIQTSRHASIPVEDAKKLWPVIQRVMKGKKDYEVGMTLGHYELTKICTNGNIVVGCHDIAFDEIEGIAHQLGLLKAKEAA